ncbi:hypothetical protein [Streptomyces sp. NBC_00140]|uniref:hypothetical protein n=1 Tax=Streptomyces sp. NBC_00140 TaxID=2975664 RepID=UPI002253139D|nr:hypothetical protein [Streptomyces sp. NBC_00140]MCX5328542.1 hypothetical protein [Streptomyces sp. NBC_00140]
MFAASPLLSPYHDCHASSGGHVITRSNGPEHAPENECQRELAAFARDLKDLKLVNGMGYRDFEKLSNKHSLSVTLSASGVSDVMSGKRWPSRDFLLALVRVLLIQEDGGLVELRDSRLQQWDHRWRRLVQLRDRANQSTPLEVQHSSPSDEPAPVQIDFVPPPGDATLQELDSAKSDLREILSNLETHANDVRNEFRQVLSEQSRVAAELSRLAELLEKERNHNETLERQIEELEQLRAELGRQLEDLRDQLAEIDSDKAVLFEDESELNDRRAMLNFDWARYEEDRRARAEAEAARLREELTDVKHKLEAADQLIRDGQAH